MAHLGKNRQIQDLQYRKGNHSLSNHFGSVIAGGARIKKKSCCQGSLNGIEAGN